MKWKHISEHFLEKDGVGRGGGAGGTEAPAKHGCFIQQQAGIPGNKGPFCTSHLGNLFASFRRSQMPAAKCVQEGIQEIKTERSGESSANLATDKSCWCQQGAFGWGTPRGAGPVLVAVSLSSISQAGRHGTGSSAAGAPYLKSSSKKEMSRFAFSYWSREECSSLHYTVHSGLPQACLWARTALKTPVSFPFKCTLQTNLFGGFQRR